MIAIYAFVCSMVAGLVLTWKVMMKWHGEYQVRPFSQPIFRPWLIVMTWLFYSALSLMVLPESWQLFPSAKTEWMVYLGRIGIVILGTKIIVVLGIGWIYSSPTEKE